MFCLGSILTNEVDKVFCYSGTADPQSLAKVVIGTKGAQIKAIMEKSGTGLSCKRGQLGCRQNRAESCMIAFHYFSVPPKCQVQFSSNSGVGHLFGI